LEAQLDGRIVFFFYAPEFFAVHNAKLGKDWQPDDNVMEDFRNFAIRRGVEFTAADYERDRAWIRERLREELFITAFSKEESDKVAFQNDPEVLKAIESLPASKALLDKAHDVIARQAKKPQVSAEAR
jgi:hypothetical protein